MSAFDELAALMAAGVPCTQDAGDGPLVYAKGREKPFSSRTARQGERLGLMVLAWCPDTGHWRWTLTQKGRRFITNPTQEADK